MPKNKENKISLENLLLVVKTVNDKQKLKQEISNFLLNHPQNQSVKIEDIRKDYPILHKVLTAHNLDLYNFIEQELLESIMEELEKVEEVEVFVPTKIIKIIENIYDANLNSNYQNQQDQDKNLAERTKSLIFQELADFVYKNICKNCILNLIEEKELSGGLKIIYKGFQKDLSLNNLIKEKLQMQI